MNEIVFLAYILLILSVTYYYRIKSKNKYNQETYLVSNRQLGVWDVAFSSLAATFTAAGVLFAFGITILHGVAGYGIFIAYFLQTLIMALFAPSLYKIVKRSNGLTFSSFFKERFGMYSEKTYALISIIFMFGFIVGAFSINISLLEIFLDLDKYVATIISFSIVIFYLLLGGFRAVVKTDKLQFIVMVLFSVALIFFIKNPVPFSDTVDIPAWFSGAFWILVPVFFLSNIANTATWQPVIAARNEKVAKKGLILASFLSVLFYLPIVWSSFTFARNLPNVDVNLALFEGMNVLFPAALIPFLFIMLYATAMSTLDTSLFYTATNTAKNLLPAKIKSSKDELFLIKLFIIIFAILAIIFSFFISGFVDFMLSLFPIIGVTAFPLFIGIFTRLPDKKVSLAILIGLLVFAFLFIFPPSNYLWNVLPGLVTGLILISYILYRKFVKRNFR